VCEGECVGGVIRGQLVRVLCCCLVFITCSALNTVLCYKLEDHGFKTQ
jgi:hypothetical protein